MRLHRLIHESATCNVWMIEWPPGTGLDWHDHGRSAAHIQVLEGWLYEEVRWSDDGPISERRHFRGTHVGVDSIASHRIVNYGPETALSLHTYTPPLTVEYPDSLELVGQTLD